MTAGTHNDRQEVKITTQRQKTPAEGQKMSIKKHNMTSVTQEIHKEMEKGSRETKNHQKHTKKESQNYENYPKQTQQPLTEQKSYYE